MYKDGGGDTDADFFYKKKKNQHRITMRMINEMGREWEGIGRGIRSRPPNIPPYPPTQCVWGGGGGQEEDFFYFSKKKQNKN